VVSQFTTQERRHTVLRRQREALNSEISDADPSDDDPEIHHVMTDIPRRDNTFSLVDLIGKYRDDPAMKVWTSTTFLNFASEMGSVARFCAET